MSEIPEYSGDRGQAGDPGTTSKSMPPPDAGGGLVGDVGVQEGIPGDQPDDPSAVLAQLQHQLGPLRGGGGFAGGLARRDGDRDPPSARRTAGCSKTDRRASLSITTALAFAIASTAPRVNRSGSPGPVPTKITRPPAPAARSEGLVRADPPRRRCAHIASCRRCADALGRYFTETGKSKNCPDLPLIGRATAPAPAGLPFRRVRGPAPSGPTH